MGKLLHLTKKGRQDPLEDIAAEIVAAKAVTKGLLILFVNHDGSVSYQMFNPDNDLSGMLMAHKLVGMELDGLIKETYE
jgi:hypothetical protein